MQSWPRPWVIMKLTVSGVTFSAAQTKSPSFSRSSSSTTMMTRPWRMASTASSMVENWWLEGMGSSLARGSADRPAGLTAGLKLRGWY